MSHKDLVTFKSLNNLSLIQKERDRLEGLIKKEPHKFWSWIPNWLAKTNEDHFANGTSCQMCCVCGVYPLEIVYGEFSFCEEYDCEIGFCKDCLKKLSKLNIGE